MHGSFPVQMQIPSGYYLQTMNSNLNLGGFLLPVSVMNVISILPLLILAPFMEYFSTCLFPSKRDGPFLPACISKYNLPLHINGLQLYLFLFIFVYFLRSHMEVSRLGVELELQLPAFATATCNLSCVCDLHHSSWQCQILNPLSKARDRTCIPMDTSWVLNPMTTRGNLSSLILTRWEEGEFDSDDIQLLKFLHRHHCPIFFLSFYTSSEDTSDIKIW